MIFLNKNSDRVYAIPYLNRFSFMCDTITDNLKRKIVIRLKNVFKKVAKNQEIALMSSRTTKLCSFQYCNEILFPLGGFFFIFCRKLAKHANKSDKTLNKKPKLIWFFLGGRRDSLHLRVRHCAIFCGDSSFAEEAITNTYQDRYIHTYVFFNYRYCRRRDV